MGGLRHLLPFTYSMMIIGSLALIGFPFLSGFYSKDLILELAYSKYNTLGSFSYYLGTIGASITSFYATRAIFLTFLLIPSGYKQYICYAQESGLPIILALSCLALPSIFIGYYSKDMVVGFGSPFFGSAVILSIDSFTFIEAEFIKSFFKNTPVMYSAVGASLATFFYSQRSKGIFRVKTKTFEIFDLYLFLNKKWFFDKIYHEYLGQFFFKFGYSISYKFVDKGVIESLGPTGTTITIFSLSPKIETLSPFSLYRNTLLISISIVYFLLINQLFLAFNHVLTIPKIEGFLIIALTMLISSIFIIDNNSESVDVSINYLFICIYFYFMFDLNTRENSYPFLDETFWELPQKLIGLLQDGDNITIAGECDVHMSGEYVTREFYNREYPIHNISNDKLNDVMLKLGN